MIEGSKPSEMPRFIRPQLASLRTKVPAGDRWLHEIKYDGYRLQVHLNKGRVAAYRRHLAHAQKRKGFDWERWNRRWLYDTLGLFNAYRVRRDGPKVAPAG